MAPARRFPLAPMDRPMRLLTGVVLALPVLLLVLPMGPASGRWLAPALLVSLIVVTALAWRPVAFEVEPGTLALRYPVRTKRIDLSTLAAVERLDGAGFRARYPGALRVGVGGLFGGFGWLWTSKGWVEMDVSRTDQFVLVTWRDRVPLLLTPEDPAAFVAALQRPT